MSTDHISWVAPVRRQRPDWRLAATCREGAHLAKHIHLVFSDPPAGVTEVEFNEWYDAHVQEILAVDGWVAATRYRLDPIVGADQTGGYRYLSLYELDVPPEQAVANLAAAGMGNADAYLDKKADDDPADPLPLPSWFAGIRFGSWNAVATSARIVPDPSYGSTAPVPPT